MVVSSTGPHFCAGLDVSMFGSGALEVAKRIASKAPVAIAATKQMISYTRDHSVAESFAYLNALQPAIFDIEEIKLNLKKSKT